MRGRGQAREHCGPGVFAAPSRARSPGDLDGRGFRPRTVAGGGFGQNGIEQITDAVQTLATFRADSQADAHVTDGARPLSDGLADLRIGNRFADAEIHDGGFPERGSRKFAVL